MMTRVRQTVTENEEIEMMLINPFRASDCVEYVTPSLVEGRAFLVEDTPLSNERHPMRPPRGHNP